MGCSQHGESCAGGKGVGPGCRISLLLPSRATQPPPPQARRDLLQKDRYIQTQDPLGPKNSLSHGSPAKNSRDITDIRSKGDRSCWLFYPGRSPLVAPHGPQPCCRGTTVPQVELGTRRALRPCALHRVHLQCSESRTSQQEASSSTDQDHVGYGLGGPRYRETAGHRDGHPSSGECWRVTGPSASQCSAGDLAAPSAGSTARVCRGCGGGKALGKGESWWDEQDRELKKQNLHGPWITEGFLLTFIFLTNSLHVIYENRGEAYSREKSKPTVSRASRTQPGGEHLRNCAARAQCCASCTSDTGFGYCVSFSPSFFH